MPSSLLDLELQVSPNVQAGVEGEADRRHPTERVGRVLVGNTGWCKRGPVVAPEEGVAQPRGGPENPGLVECEGEELTLTKGWSRGGKGDNQPLPGGRRGQGTILDKHERVD